MDDKHAEIWDLHNYAFHGADAVDDDVRHHVALCGRCREVVADGIERRRAAEPVSDTNIVSSLCSRRGWRVAAAVIAVAVAVGCWKTIGPSSVGNGDGDAVSDGAGRASVGDGSSGEALGTETPADAETTKPRPEAPDVWPPLPEEGEIDTLASEHRLSFDAKKPVEAWTQDEIVEFMSTSSALPTPKMVELFDRCRREGIVEAIPKLVWLGGRRNLVGSDGEPHEQARAAIRILATYPDDYIESWWEVARFTDRFGTRLANVFRHLPDMFPDRDGAQGADETNDGEEADDDKPKDDEVDKDGRVSNEF